ncbi:conserved Plasmodium protein, unknown function [Plasmodium relictum]|uniref:Peptidase n=1 Tax=Plasmodium relictum TaxID=85471 RepID=A0A1J1H290_PLARL|nr:conserved Plasmodium protein, unknown function [Plasmodium relictum]CRG99043.1 conserved Plasmodium protein, unknown function [Plasmodium relictum]
MEIENKKCKNCFITFILLFVLMLYALGSRGQNVKSFKRENERTNNEGYNNDNLLNKFSESKKHNNIDTLYDDDIKKSLHDSEDKNIPQEYLTETNDKNYETFILKKNSKMNNLDTHSKKLEFVNENNIHKNDNHLNENNYFNNFLPNLIDENVNLISGIHNFTGVKNKQIDDLKYDSSYIKKEMYKYENNGKEKENEKHNTEKDKDLEESKKIVMNNNTILYNKKKKINNIDEVEYDSNVENLKKNNSKIYGSSSIKENRNGSSKNDFNVKLISDNLDSHFFNNNIDENISKSDNNINNNFYSIGKSNNSKSTSLNYVNSNTEISGNEDENILGNNNKSDNENNDNNENNDDNNGNNDNNINNNGSNDNNINNNGINDNIINNNGNNDNKSNDNNNNNGNNNNNENNDDDNNNNGNNDNNINNNGNNNNNENNDDDNNNNGNNDNNINNNGNNNNNENNDDDNNNNGNNDNNINNNGNNNNNENNDDDSNNNGNNNNNENNDDDSNNNGNNDNNINNNGNNDNNSNNNNNNENNDLYESDEKKRENDALNYNSNINKNNSLKNSIYIDNNDNFNGVILNIYFTESINLYTKVKVGGQLLNLSLNSRLEGIYVFMKDSQACYKNDVDRNCYDPNISKKSTWCNNDLICLPPILTKPYECYSENILNIQNKVEYPNIYYDSLKFSESHIEGSDDVEIIDILNKNSTSSIKELSFFENSNIKLVLDITFYKNWSLFKDTDGILGLAGKELGCRNSSVWNKICEKNNLLFAFDINLPENAIVKYVPEKNEKIVKKNAGKYKKSLNKVLKTSELKKGLKNNLCKKGMKYCQYDPNYTDEKLANNKKNNYKNKYGKIQVTSNKNNIFNKENSIINHDRNKLKEKVKSNHYVINPDIISYNSEIHIGDYKKDYGSIIWAEPRERGGIFSDSFMQFTIYNLEVCNKNIFGKYSSNWQGVIDLSSKCLILPKMFWLSLMEYLPVNKNDERCIPKNKNFEINENTLPRMCSVNEKNRPLPVLKFVFSDNDIVSDNNINNVETNLQEISIPLDNLIINENTENKNYLCIIPDIQEGKSSENSGRTTKPLIKFGTYVLNNLYVVVDQDNYRVGFAQKKSYYYSNDKCTKKMECIGDQMYEPALNICVNPDCSIWYFYMLNDETKKCESLSPRFYFFILIILTLLILDIQSYYFYRKSVHVAKVSSR